MVYLDLDELDSAFRGRWLWSARRPTLAWFRRADYLGPVDLPLDEAVRRRVEEQTGVRPSGPIRVLTHLRYFGFLFNPATFYLCFDEDESLEAVVLEITNTPWGERHSYVMSCVGSGTQRACFAKEFHVSPFMPMDQSYDLTLSLDDHRLVVHMRNLEGDECVFDATLALERREWSAATLARSLLRFPVMTLSVIVSIYWQAFRLWTKRAAFHPHPRQLETHGAEQ